MSRLDAYISRYGDFCPHDDDTTDYFTPCACARGTNTISHNTTNHDNIECQNIHTDNNITINHTADTMDDDSLVILAKQTTLTDSQKNV